MVNSRRGDRPGPGRGPSGKAKSSASGSRSGSAGAKRDASGRRRGAAGSVQRETEQPAESPETGTQNGASRGGRKRRSRRRYGFTTRAVALAVVLLILTISYASSLRVYFSQRHDIAEKKAEIARSKHHVRQLHDEIDRWDDDKYVRIQARERLGWVKPGETGYRVVGSDGDPVTKTVGLAEHSDSGSADKHQASWYHKLWGSMKHADRPPKRDPDPQHTKKPITKDTKPSSGPS